MRLYLTELNGMYVVIKKGFQWSLTLENRITERKKALQTQESEVFAKGIGAQASSLT